MNVNLVKRILSLILTVALLLGNVPATVFAVDTTTEDAIAETIAETAAPTETAAESVQETVAPTETATEAATIPAKETESPTQPAVPEKTVLPEDTQPTEVTIAEEAVMAVDVVASGTCGNNLTWVLTQDGTLTISGIGSMNNYGATKYTAPWLDYCHVIETVVVEPGVTTIGVNAFHNLTKVTQVKIPYGVTSIGVAAFENCCELTSIDIPDSVTDISFGAFNGCSGLESMTIPFVGGSPKTEDDEYQYPFGYIFGGNYYTGGWETEQVYVARNTDLDVSVTSSVYYIPQSLDTVKVTGGSVLRGAFSNCGNINTIIIGDNVINIGYSAFWGCTALHHLTIPFVGDRVKTETDSRQYPFGYIFGEISFPLAVKAEQRYNRSGKDLGIAFNSVDYYIPRNLETVVVTGGHILMGAFSNCKNIENIILPKNITDIGNYAFYGCEALKSIGIPNNVKNIGYQAFYGCTKLKRFEIPAAVCRIAKDAFKNCTNLVDVCVTEPSNWCNTSFANDYSNPMCYGEYLHILDNQGNEKMDIVLNSSVTTIPDFAFRGCGMTSIFIPESVVSINASAFCGCDGLRDVYYGGTAEQWTKLGSNAPKARYIHYSCTTLGDHWEKTLVEPTCTEEGYVVEKCCCGYESIDVNAPALSHVMGSWYAISEANCIETGIRRRDCSRCDHFETESIPVADHSYEAVVTPPTCTEDGYTTHTCQCGDTYKDAPVEKLGHVEVVDEGFDPTCIETGLTEGSHCAVCGEICVAQEEIPALGHAYEAQNKEIVCAVCGETVTIHIHQDYVALDIYENPQLQLDIDISPADLTEDLYWSIEGENGILHVDQNGFVTAFRAGTAYVVAELTVDGYTISSRCRVDVTENVQVKGVQLSTNKVTAELYKDEYATFEILLDLPQNHPFVGDALMVTDDAAMAASGLENKSNLIKSVQFKTISDLFVLELLDDRTVQIVPTEKAMKEGVKGTPSDTVVVTLRNGQTLETTEKLTLTVKKTMPKLKASIAAFNSFYEGQSQKIVITGADVTGIRKNENEKTPIPTWLTLEDGCLKLNGKTPKSSDKAYLLVDVDGWVDPVELTLTVKHAKKVPGIKLAATKVTVAERNASTEVELKLLCTSKTDVLKDLNITGITAPKGYTVENFNAEDGTFTLKKDGGFTSDEITLTVSYGSATKDLTLNVNTQAVKLKLSSSKVSLNKELPDQAVVEVICTTENYNFDLKDAVLTYDGKMLDIVPVGNALVIKLKNGAEFKKTYPVTISAYEGAPTVKLSVAVLKKDSEVKSTIKATGTLDVIREDTAITIKPTYTNYLNVNVDTDAVLKIYSSKDSFKTAIAEVTAENGIFTIDSSIIGNHTLKYKAQLETKIYEDKDPIKSNQISLSVKMGAAKLTAKSSGTTMFAKDRNDRALVWFEAADATLNDVKTIKIKDTKYKDVFEIIDYRDGSFAIAFKDGKLHESIAKQLEKKASISITLSLDVFMEGNESAKANTTQKVKLTIVK